MKFIANLFGLILLVSILPISISQAQDSEKTHSLQKGSRALQFQITDDFTLDSFSGTIFSYKRQLSDVRAQRMGLSLSNRYYWQNFPENDNQDASNLELGIGIDYTWMNYMNPESDIKFYYGYGPGINFGFDRSEQEETGEKDINQRTSYGIAGLGYAGVEWFFQSSMSLHAEYRASVQFIHRREKVTTITNGNEQINKTNTTSISLAGNGIRLGLSVYF